MKTVFKKLSFLLALAIFYTDTQARVCYPVTLNITPYAGINVEGRHMNFSSGFGDNLFARNYPQIDIYTGVKLNEFWGVELGYETTFSQRKTTTLTPGAINLGIPITADVVSAQFRNSSRISGAHLDLVGFWCIPEYPIELFGTIGASYLAAKFQRLTQAVNGVATSIPRTFEHEKTVLQGAFTIISLSV